MTLRSNKGFTLVELMIGIVLALFIVGGLYTMLGSSQLSYSLARSNNALNSSGQRVTQLIWNQLHQAGYINYQRQIMQRKLPAGGVSLSANTWAEGQSLFAENNLTMTGVLANTDRLVLRFWGSSISDNDPAQPSNQSSDNRMFDCNGDFKTNQNLVTVTLFVNNQNQLICQDNQAHTVVMEDNVESLQFRFRRVGTNQQFVPANIITAASAWATVDAVEFGVLTRQNSGQGVKANAKNYNILDQVVNSAADRWVRQSLTGSITLKN
jgi:prepilin-type N-terminal cleavage/methylation domain-containing protein